MKFIERSVSVEAESGLGANPRPELIGPILTKIPRSLRDSVRMAFLRSSHPAGRIPDSIKAACAITFKGKSGKGKSLTELIFQVPSFGEAAPQFYEQDTFWPEFPKPEETAFDLLGLTLRDLDTENSDSSHFDQKFLKELSGYGSVFKKGISRLSLGRDNKDTNPYLDEEVVQTANRLSLSTPDPRRVRVSGRLDVMGASKGILKIEVKPGSFASALWNGKEEIETHKALFNKDVVLEGTAIFRPSGTLLRIEADILYPMAKQDEFFREIPYAVAQNDYTQASYLKVEESSAYKTILGSIPAEESDEEFIAALENLR